MKHGMFATLLPALLAVPVLAVAEGVEPHEVHYVRPLSGGGYGSGAGTSYANAWNGLGGFYGTSRLATADTTGRVDPGDTLYVCGRHTAEQFVFGPANGSSVGDGSIDNRITISFDCPGDPGSIEVGNTQNYAFLTNQKFITLVNPRLAGGVLGVPLSLEPFGGAGNVDAYFSVIGGEVWDCRDYAQKCINIRGRNNSIDGTYVHDGAGDGIWAKGKYLTIRNTRVERISTGGAAGDCLQINEEIDGTVFAGNHCDHTNTDSKYCFVIEDTDGGLATITGNTCLRRSTDTVGSGLYTKSRAVIANNYFRGGQFGIHLAQDNGEKMVSVVNNVISAASSSGIAKGSTSAPTKIAGNSISGAVGTRCIRSEANGASIEISHNILSGCEIGIEKVDVNSSNVDFENYFSCVGQHVVVAGEVIVAGSCP